LHKNFSRSDGCSHNSCVIQQNVASSDPIFS
jgi:hypothetical protein